jgi:hypothetical protein
MLAVLHGFLFYGVSTAQVRGNDFGMAHPPALPFSFLRAMGEAMKETPVEENNGYVVSK